RHAETPQGPCGRTSVPDRDPTHGVHSESHCSALVKASTGGHLMSDSSPATPSTAPATTTVIAAELIGTFWLVLGGCGTAVFAAVQIATADTGDVPVGVGYLGVAIAFGLTVLTGAYA